MTVNLSGAREGPTWTLDPSSAADSGHHFLGEFAKDPAVASFFNNPFPTRSSMLEGTAKTRERHGDLRMSYADERETTLLRSGNPFARIVDRPVEGETENFSEQLLYTCGGEDDPFANRNGWSTARRPQSLLGNGISRPVSTPLNSVRSPNSSHLTSPHHAPSPVHHSPSPHSITSPQMCLSPHQHSSLASSPATPTDGFPGNLAANCCSRTQPVASAPSPFIASRLPSCLPVNSLNQISNYDLIDTLVTLKPTCRDVALQGQVGVVKHVATGETATVHILSTDGDIRVPCSSLQPVQPREKNAVKVIGGTHCLGRIGTLVTITGEYGIVKFIRGDNIAQIPLKNLGKYSPTKPSGVKAVDYLAKSGTSPSSPSSSSVSESGVSSSVNGAATSYPLMALSSYHSIPFFFPQAAPQGGCFVSIPQVNDSPSVPSSSNGIYTSSPFASVGLFPGMMSPYVLGGASRGNTTNGMLSSSDLSSTSGPSRGPSMFAQNSLSFGCPPTLSGGPLKSDDLSPTSTFKDTPSLTFSFSRQDSVERDSVQRSAPVGKDPLRPSHFDPERLSLLSQSVRPSVIQTHSNSAPSGERRQKGLLQPSHAIERAKAFMATAAAMEACPPRAVPVPRGGVAVVARGGGGASPHSNGRVPPPYSTVRLGGHSGNVSDHHVQKNNCEEKIKRFIGALVQNRRGYAFRRNSGDGSHDVKTSCIRISLVCPLSQKRMSYPSRGHSCRHHQCFDADAYVRYNLAQKAKKKMMKQPNGKCSVQAIINKRWQCPICHSAVIANQLYIDKDIYAAVRESSAQEVELSDDGSWRPVQKEEKKIEVIDLTDLDD